MHVSSSSRCMNPPPHTQTTSKLVMRLLRDLILHSKPVISVASSYIVSHHHTECHITSHEAPQRPDITLQGIYGAERIIVDSWCRFLEIKNKVAWKFGVYASQITRHRSRRSKRMCVCVCVCVCVLENMALDQGNRRIRANMERTPAIDQMREWVFLQTCGRTRNMHLDNTNTHTRLYILHTDRHAHARTHTYNIHVHQQPPS